jgi:predicted RNase H-like HicB family nuclease
MLKNHMLRRLSAMPLIYDKWFLTPRPEGVDEDRDYAYHAHDLEKTRKTYGKCSEMHIKVSSPMSIMVSDRFLYPARFRWGMKRNFTVLIEKDEDGMFIGSVLGLKGCHTQGKTLDELMDNVKEAIALCLEETKPSRDEFVGIQHVQVSV